MGWIVYMLRCADGTLYTGITTDVTRRVAMHEAGTGAKYTRGRGPFKVVLLEDFESKGDALRRELAIKALPAAQKLTLAKAYSARRPRRS